MVVMWNEEMDEAFCNQATLGHYKLCASHIFVQAIYNKQNVEMLRLLLLGKCV